MKRLLMHMTWSSLLLIACNSNTADQPPADSARSSGLSDKILAIAAALPVKRDSADAFFAGLFVPSDSLKIAMDGDFKTLRSKDFTLVLLPGDSTISEVQITPVNTSLFIPLKELVSRMDSAWEDTPEGPFLRKEPLPSVTAFYTDHQHRRKKIEVEGLSQQELARDSLIRMIRISVVE
jgi:hypothetical protein